MKQVMAQNKLRIRAGSYADIREAHFPIPELPSRRARGVRKLVYVLGDQLNRNTAAFEGFDPVQDAVFMAEVDHESQYVWTAKQKIAVFLAAMRHFAVQLQRDQISVFYTRLDSPANSHNLINELDRAVAVLRPQSVVLCEPGEWRLAQAFCNYSNTALEIREDTHFYCSRERFRDHASGRKQLRLEYFYREMREREDVLMNGQLPIGGQWNFDPENRKSFGADGPRNVPTRLPRESDAITDSVLSMVEARFADHPGSLEIFDWPLTREQALKALDDFVVHRLPWFGDYQDAMWTEEPWLFHSHLSSALNLKLLDPREVIAKAVSAHQSGAAPLAAVEGFVRQILGWREYVRGIYWQRMPEYLELNALDARAPLPAFYWTGDVPMLCLRETVRQTLTLGYAHHIQRLMVTGLYALLLGVRPREVHAWYLAVYVDAVEWVELPNTLGMSQYADGGVMASKPYAATGKYIARMSNYCKGCRFDPAKSTGEDACPFTTLYWDFLARNKDLLLQNQRMALQIKNLDRLSAAQSEAIASRAEKLRNADGVPMAF